MTVKVVWRRPRPWTHIISRTSLAAPLTHKQLVVHRLNPHEGHLIRVSLPLREASVPLARVVRTASTPNVLLVVRKAGGTTVPIVLKSLNGARRCLRNTGVGNPTTDLLETHPFGRPQAGFGRTTATSTVLWGLGKL